MPHTVNGIGTWYYGKQHAQSYTAACSACKFEGVLSSYDTRLFFVILFIPIIPLGRKHVIDECSRCHRHGVIAGSEWDKEVAHVDAMIAEFRAAPARADVAREAMKQAIGYRMRDRFLIIAQEVETHLSGDHESLVLAAAGYEFFDRFVDQERALRLALAVKNDEDTREMLAASLLHQKKPDEAESYLGHIVEQANPDKVRMLFWLAQVYQLQGRHDRALAYFNHCEAIDPRITGDADFIRLRHASQQHLGSDTPLVPTEVIRQAERAQKTQTFARFAPAVAVLLVGAYLGVAWLVGYLRHAYLVNGLDMPYTVRLNGKDYRLTPGEAQRVRLGEGTVRMEFVEPKLPVGPQQVAVTTPLLTRPFVKRTVVVNPDRTAIIAQIRTYYANEDEDESTLPEREDAGARFVAGKPVMTFTGIEYPFEPFPDTIRLENDTQVVPRDRLALVTGEFGLSPVEAPVVLTEPLGKAVVAEIARQHVRLQPDSMLYHGLLYQLLTPQERVAFLKDGINTRPVNVEWHRSYQEAMSALGRDEELERDYDTLLEQHPTDSALLYLAGRSRRDTAQARALFQQAAACPTPCPYAYSALAHAALANGQFPAALGHARNAQAGQPDNLMFAQVLDECLLACGQHEELLRRLRARPSSGFFIILGATRMEVAALCAMDRPQEAQAALERGIQRLTSVTEGDNSDISTPIAILRATMAYCREDVATYLAEMTRHGKEQDSLEVALTRGDLAAADRLCRTSQKTTYQEHLLCYLLAMRQRQPAIADAHLAQATTKMNGEGYPERVSASALQGKPAVSHQTLRAVSLGVDDKAIILAALGTRYPAERAQYFALARRLNFNRQFPHLLLRSVLGG